MKKVFFWLLGAGLVAVFFLTYQGEAQKPKAVVEATKKKNAKVKAANAKESLIGLSQADMVATFGRPDNVSSFQGTEIWWYKDRVVADSGAGYMNLTVNYDPKTNVVNEVKFD